MESCLNCHRHYDEYEPGWVLVADWWLCPTCSPNWGPTRMDTLRYWLHAITGWLADNMTWILIAVVIAALLLMLAIMLTGPHESWMVQQSYDIISHPPVDGYKCLTTRAGGIWCERVGQ